MALVHPANYEWLEQQLQASIHYPSRPLDPDQALQFSMRIQTAYEERRPLLMIAESPLGLTQFCGYVDRIDPKERWIQLENGCIRKQIFFHTLQQVEVI